MTPSSAPLPIISGEALTDPARNVPPSVRERAPGILWRRNDFRPEFAGPAYDYLLKADELPAFDELPAVADIGEHVCRVKLFLPEGRYTYYVVAATDYEWMHGPILTGFCVSAFGPDADEFGDTALLEIAQQRSSVLGLPVERDLAFDPVPLAAVRVRHR